IARKDRNSENWYLGSVTDENGRTLTVPLSFLTPGKKYRAQIYADGPTADYRGHGKDIVIEERPVTSADTLTLRLAPGGGQAIRFVAGKGEPLALQGSGGGPRPRRGWVRAGLFGAFRPHPPVAPRR